MLEIIQVLPTKKIRRAVLRQRPLPQMFRWVALPDRYRKPENDSLPCSVLDNPIWTIRGASICYAAAPLEEKMPQPAVMATWMFGRIAVQTALPLLLQGRPALDAAIAGAQAVEDDPTVDSVGYGGLPNSIGVVQLDACVMEGRNLNCGAVAGLENVRHAAALARRVMEQTVHIMVVGEGAQRFAIQQGFPLENMLTPQSLAEWQRRREALAQKNAGQKGAQPAIDTPWGHDTVTVLALDQAGNLGGVCTTSGLANKLPGRVGDSPVIGAGLYVDNQAGAAGATGVGEEVIRIGGSQFIAEQMRGGRTPQEACEQAVRRLNQLAVRRGVHPAHVAFIALDTQGRHGAACSAMTDFKYAISVGPRVELRQARELDVEANP
jgi:isoaspartyl peptidase/L-asparaginase-like protein (Ntn-hydrolase superfamily)